MENKAAVILGERIKEGRLRLNLNQQDLLDKLELRITPGFLSMVEKGQRIPVVSTIIKMADLFGINRRSLFIDMKHAKLEQYSSRLESRWKYWLERKDKEKE